MRGTYEVKVSNVNVSFTLELERNITILSGDSATGKTTLIEMLRDFEESGRSSGVTVHCKRPCRVLTNADWEYRLNGIRDSIVFLDEGNAFVKSEAFASAVQNSDNYYVIVTRESLSQLPYSVNSIMKLKTTGKRDKTYIRAYPQYSHLADPVGRIGNTEGIVTEDSNAGYEMFSHIAQQNGVHCVAAQGKSNVFATLTANAGHRVLVIADGAAFGAELDKIYRLMEAHPNQITLYLPESFEWLLLKSGILGSKTPKDILDDPAAYIESSVYFSWEQYFTDLLIQLTSGTVLHYSKTRLNPVYLQPANVAKVLQAMADEKGKA